MPPHTRPPGARDDAAHALAEVGPVVSRWMERLLAGHDPPLTLAQYLMLRAVAGGEAVGADLARSAGISPSAVAQILAGLEQAGLVARAREPADRRRQSIVPSRAGDAALRSAEQELRSGLGTAVRDLAPHEGRELARALRRVHAALSGTPPPPRPPRPHGPPAPPHG